LEIGCGSAVDQAVESAFFEKNQKNMPVKMLEQFWLYNNWANDILFKTFESYGERMPASCLRLLSHIVDVQSTWLVRVTGEKPVVGVWDLHDLEGCKRLHQETSKGLKVVMEAHANDLNALINYTNTQGRAFQNTIFDMMFQVFNHGTYHRAQIAMEMRKNDLQPVNTDYIGFVR
jgi:uncharacterized damage-inducible protein DinB